MSSLESSCLVHEIPKSVDVLPDEVLDLGDASPEAVEAVGEADVAAAAASPSVAASVDAGGAASVTSSGSSAGPIRCFKVK
jgi:hypothetical protein